MKLSIITIAYNNLAGLQKTLPSVLAQTYTDFEHIIVDGGSTDGSVDYIANYAAQTTERNIVCKWLSEPDKGIYNAMNKGIRMATGEYCLFLNGGDYLCEAASLQFAISNGDWVEDMIYCDKICISSDGKETKVSYPKNISAYFLWQSALPHQASFFKRTALFDFGLYNEMLKYASDWELCLKMFVNNHCTYRHIPIYLSYFDTTGISSQSSNRQEMLEERQQVFARLCPSLITDFQRLQLLEKQIKNIDRRASSVGKVVLCIPRKLKYTLKKKFCCK